MTGRPVDVEIVPRAHAILSASSAERWINCTPSARIEEALEDDENDFARDGTAAHALAEIRLRYKLGLITKPEYVSTLAAARAMHEDLIEEWTPLDWEAINQYVDFVLAEHERIGGTVEVEARVSYTDYAEEGFGTADALLVNHEKKIVKVIDLKFGKGVPVSAVNNSQLKLYGLGGLVRLGLEGHEGWTVEWTIHQPRLDTVDTDETSAEELIEWAETVVKPAAALAWEGKGLKKVTEAGCRFCKAKATCRERVAQNMLIARRDFMGDPDLRFNPEKLDEHLMSAEELAKILPDLDAWISWASAAKSRALAMARDEGQRIPGFKLVRGRSIRGWRPGVDVAEALRAKGVSETDIFDKPKVRSVAQVEKTLGKPRFEAATVGMVVKPEGAPTLVPESDPRPAVDLAGEARREFGFGE